MELQIQMFCENSAFEENDGEIRKCLEQVIYCLESGQVQGPIWDSYGNNVGTFVLA